MAYGMQVFNSSGTLILDVSNRITRYIGSYAGTLGASASTTVTVPGITPDGTWFVVTGNPLQLIVTINNGSVGLTSMVTGSSMNWTFFVFRC